MTVRCKETPFGGWRSGVVLTDGRIELRVTTEVGPRVLHFGLKDGPNLFHVVEQHLGRTGGRGFRLYGGHRLWHAPERDGRTNMRDNTPVPWSWKGGVLSLRPVVEAATGMRKELDLCVAADGSVEVRHTLINEGPWPVEVAPWALSIMAAGGTALIPQEPYHSHKTHKLPARLVALWPYTDMADPRWTWGRRFVRIQQSADARDALKVGFGNTCGWAAYALAGTLFLKRFPYLPGARYPDFGCNTEVFTDRNILEIESIGPLAVLDTGARAEHVERWSLHRLAPDADDDALARQLAPLLKDV